MRIASLLSSATEIVYELGLQDRLVAISHECDWPPEALHLPRLSRVRFDPAGLSSGEVDAEVRRCMAEHGSVYAVDEDALRRARPDLVLTQAVCEVCAVPTGSVLDAVAALAAPPRVLSLDAHTLEEIVATVRQVADAAGEPARGEAAAAGLRERMGRVRDAVAGRPRPRVLALEWLDPPFAPGHWVPEMIDAAGGECLVGAAGAHSLQVAWSEVAGLEPDRLLLVPCGYALEQARADADRVRARLVAAAPAAVARGDAAVGHSAYFSRSGPRVVRGIEALAAWLHPGAAAGASAAGILERWE
ncbi:MAG TPA: ABC transporter substrate-binding protein [Longimicrobiaceae bacterium]|nr:ABC transporter substrate-binding protein [Longimicrobiaceae bacterium]